MATKTLAPLSKPLQAPTRDEINTVLEGLEQRWSVNALGVQQRFTEAIERDDASSAQRWAVAGGISTEKVLLMKGRPTEIVANLHAHRHDLSSVMDKLAGAARVVQIHERKGHVPVRLPIRTVAPPVLATREHTGINTGYCVFDPPSAWIEPSKSGQECPLERA